MSPPGKKQWSGRGAYKKMHFLQGQSTELSHHFLVFLQIYAFDKSGCLLLPVEGERFRGKLYKISETWVPFKWRKLVLREKKGHPPNRANFKERLYEKKRLPRCPSQQRSRML